MRKRPLIILSTVAAATLLLAGCSGSADPEATGTPSPDAAQTSCLADLKSGAGSDAVTVDGTGAAAKVTVPEGTEMVAAERSVVVEGDGDEVLPGDLVSLRYQLVDATTNEVLSSSERGQDGVLAALLPQQQPQQIVDPTQSTVFTVAAECLPVGSSIVLTLPAAQEGMHASVLYVETIEHLPTTATGSDVDATEGMPAVELDDAGSPSITIPEGEAPAETEVATLKEGDGAVVASGDLVTVQYRGVKWSDGSEFDSSWSRDAAPAQFQTTSVVTGFKLALEGQKVGSQVVVVMPPKDGYGEGEINEADLVGESLVFVVDILATTPLEQPAQ
ncbi:FKBP-type peptidyl-prolyl cis-trans isomerase [Microbacterium sp. SD291]|uniref:FKBP-type peptidyl-prolyl cis-trans isomerase n=1 Tax=Microbacterium sp. SD291 TaxID=2782007 RepID=UPI001A96C805|nr:FKBP-type peptidyl-prolyl cis-trans isomerase [Microbacterium sp. SD291]MBO0980614.1 FKBP-type peptidyl-prolyl cis-trans isomerase [Microbacterium sp. SD291]